jgi:hypothetical protein|tara:strand:+ start:10215 stop:10730 length:516 start_codon:yes stop_codon:yes gene_type:complete
MDTRITSKETELKDIINKAFEQIFVDGHALVETNSGGVSVDQNEHFESLQSTLYGLLTECLEQNLPEIPLTNESAMAKFSAPKQVLEIDYNDFDKIVEGAYGGSYEVVAEQELNNDSILEFNVPNVATFFNDDRKRIKMGTYMPYEISKIVQCLFEDGFINEGEYQIRVSW